MNTYDHLEAAALKLVEAMDAGEDTTWPRRAYDQARAVYDAERVELEAFIANREPRHHMGG